MKRRRQAIWLISMALLLCATGSVAAAEMLFSENKDSIFVMRVTPSEHRVIAFNGKVVDGDFKFSLFTPARFSGLAVDGYIVGKAKPGEYIAIYSIGSRTACGGGQTVVFRAEAGRVAYVGDVEFGLVDEKFVVSRSDNFSGARDFLVRHYPAWGGRLQSVDAQILPVQKKCEKPGPVVYYIHM